VPQKVFVTGIGIISAIGIDTKEVINSLIAQRSGIGNMSFIDSVYKNEIPVAEVRATNDELLEIANPGIRGYYSRTSLLGIIAAKQAVVQAQIKLAPAYRTGIISATTVGGMDHSEIFYKSYLVNKNKGKLRYIVSHDCGDSTEKIADCLGFDGYITTINTACSSSANAIIYGARLIKQNKLDRVIAGGVDSLTLFTINGFNSLMILDRNACRPFDENRNGLNLGEGSGFLVMESEEIVAKEGKYVLGEIRGYGNACDAYHQTASSPEGHGAYLSMKKALEVAGLLPSDIDYINAHGTGTKNNDLSEGIAIERIFKDSVPACSSTKPFTGHTLGAAGAIEAVLSILALQQQWLYPNLNFSQPMNELGFSPVTEFRTGVPINNIMSNSFGFGGNNSTLIISRH
jgi:3-oxoacyl-[acyl-carrier-protein] synthase-1